MEENSKTKRKKPRQPLYDDEKFTELLEMARESRLTQKYTATSISLHYRANAPTAKNPGEKALIYGSGLCVTLKSHGKSALVCGSGLKTA